MQKLGNINNYAGTTISLNQKEGSFFGLGDDERGMILWLTPEDWWGVIPDTVNSTDAAMLTKAIQNNRVVLGKSFCPPLDKDPSVLTKYADALADNRYVTNEFKDVIRSVLSRKSDGNYTAREIISYCMECERKTRNRKDFLTWLTEALEYYTGPDFLVEDYVEDAYDVKIDNSTMAIVSDSRSEDKKKSDTKPKRKTSRKKKASPEAEAALKELFGDSAVE
jgi:hypothetical protein